MEDLINGEGRPRQDALQSAAQEVVNAASMPTPPAESNTATPDSRSPSLTTRNVLLHALGGDKKALERILNWMTVPHQTNDRADTAWIFGRPGISGKGLMLHEVLRLGVEVQQP